MHACLLQGDRVGICVAGLDAALVERTVAAAPGALRAVTTIIAIVRGVRYFRCATCLSIFSDFCAQAATSSLLEQSLPTRAHCVHSQIMAALVRGKRPSRCTMTPPPPVDTGSSCSILRQKPHLKYM